MTSANFSDFCCPSFSFVSVPLTQLINTFVCFSVTPRPPPPPERTSLMETPRLLFLNAPETPESYIKFLPSPIRIITFQEEKKGEKKEEKKEEKKKEKEDDGDKDKEEEDDKEKDKKESGDDKDSSAAAAAAGKEPKGKPNKKKNKRKNKGKGKAAQNKGRIGRDKIVESFFLYNTGSLRVLGFEVAFG